MLKLDKPADWALLFIIILIYLILFTVLYALNDLKFTLFKSTASAPVVLKKQRQDVLGGLEKYSEQ